MSDHSINFQELTPQNTELLRRIASSVAGPHEADELISMVYERICDRQNLLANPQPVPLIKTIAKRVWIDHFRKRAIRREHPLSAMGMDLCAPDTQLNSLHDGEDLDSLHAKVNLAISSLSMDQRTCIERWLAGMNTRQIASTEGRSVSTVRHKLRSAKAVVKAHLERSGVRSLMQI